MNTVLLGLGSNISPEYNLPESLRRLAKLVRIEAVSSIWETAAVGSDGPAFLNAAAKVSTNFYLNTFKTEVLGVVEASLARVRTFDKNAPRTIDLDILVFNKIVIDQAIFHLDHLILPLAEIFPELIEPLTNKPLAQLAKEHCCKPTAVRVGKLNY
ncbi:MAG: 2-amino-4-hydroxy-6-hydroxymethyldihydropteridine diphosphokinase [Anaerolineaceae bacterium]